MPITILFYKKHCAQLKAKWNFIKRGGKRKMRKSKRRKISWKEKNGTKRNRR